MPPTYSVRSIAVMLSVPTKWVDNLLSHHTLPGVSGGRRGVERQVDSHGILAVEIARMLSSELGVPIGRAVAIARHAVANRERDDLSLQLESGATLTFHFGRIENRLRGRMLEAVEGLAHIPRGRPPRTH